MQQRTIRFETALSTNPTREKLDARTYPLVALHADDGVPVALVDPGVVPELHHPAAGRGVGRPRVHEAGGDEHARDRVAVALHRLKINRINCQAGWAHGTAYLCLCVCLLELYSR